MQCQSSCQMQLASDFCLTWMRLPAFHPQVSQEGGQLRRCPADCPASEGPPIPQYWCRCSGGVGPHQIKGWTSMEKKTVPAEKREKAGNGNREVQWLPQAVQPLKNSLGIDLALQKLYIQICSLSSKLFCFPASMKHPDLHFAYRHEVTTDS